MTINMNHLEIGQYGASVVNINALIKITYYIRQFVMHSLYIIWPMTKLE